MRLAKRPQAKSGAEVGTLRILIEALSISAFDDWLPGHGSETRQSLCIIECLSRALASETTTTPR